MPRLKLHQIVLALAVSAALTACGEKTAQTTETPQAASAASAADTAASTAAVSQPLKILPMFLTKTKPCWNARKLRSNLCLT